MSEENLEITWQETETLSPEEYCLVDIRSAVSAGYGMIPGAVNIGEEELEERLDELPPGKKSF
ncbi:MAG: ATPase, partial [Enterocloster sp.]